MPPGIRPGDPGKMLYHLSSNQTSSTPTIRLGAAVVFTLSMACIKLLLLLPTCCPKGEQDLQIFSEFGRSCAQIKLLRLTNQRVVFHTDSQNVVEINFKLPASLPQALPNDYSFGLCCRPLSRCLQLWLKDFCVRKNFANSSELQFGPNALSYLF